MIVRPTERADDSRMSVGGTDGSVISGTRAWAGEKHRRTEFIPLPLVQTHETDSANERNELRFTARSPLSANQRIDRFEALVGPTRRRRWRSSPGSPSRPPATERERLGEEAQIRLYECLLVSVHLRRCFCPAAVRPSENKKQRLTPQKADTAKPPGSTEGAPLGSDAH